MHLPSGLTALFVLVSISAHAQEIGFDDFRQADLIFQETTGAQSVAVKAATNSRYTHMGIIRITGGGPVVIEAGRRVTETRLEDFVARGKAQRFSVYRFKKLSEPKAHEIIGQAYQDMDKPYDLYFRLDPEAIYCSELPYRAFKAAGIVIGKVEKDRRPQHRGRQCSHLDRQPLAKTPSLQRREPRSLPGQIKQSGHRHACQHCTRRPT